MAKVHQFMSQIPTKTAVNGLLLLYGKYGSSASALFNLAWQYYNLTGYNGDNITISLPKDGCKIR